MLLLLLLLLYVFTHVLIAPPYNYVLEVVNAYSTSSRSSICA